MSKIDHPKHYQHPSRIECLMVAEWENFNVGNVLKYLWRRGKKPGSSELEDLRKARFYLEREIDRICRCKLRENGK